MKTCILLIFLLLGSQYVSAQVDSEMEKLSWLEGTWIRVNNKPGRIGLETWKRASGLEWQGLGVTLKGNDTTFVEKLKIVARDGKIFYVADLVENKEPTYFQFTGITDHSFVCENPQHDFPKKISYELTAGKLKATISGDGKLIDYWFEKKK